MSGKSNFKIKLLMIVALLIVIGGLFLFITNFSDETCNPVPFWSEGTPTSWDNVVEIISSGQVYLIYHQDNLCTTLFLNDGRVIDTKEPAMNKYRNEIEKCGDLCNGTQIIEISIVPWDEAVRILNTGQVKSASQTHSYKVGLVLEEDQYIYSEEPAIDEILKEIEKCGDLCKDISFMTE